MTKLLMSVKRVSQFATEFQAVSIVVLNKNMIVDIKQKAVVEENLALCIKEHN